MILQRLQKVAGVAVILGMLAALLFFPAASAQGVSEGLRSCGLQLIPALFPFLLVSALVAASPLAELLGLGLYPYVRLLGIRNRAGATALFLGLLGGFAVAANSISQFYAHGQLTKQEAELLLVCSVGSGPGFVINSVGYLMLGSQQAGILLFASLTLANLACALLFRPLFHFDGIAPIPAPPPKKETGGFVAAMQRSVGAMLSICGYVILFRFLTAVAARLAPSNGPLLFFASALLEVTGGCLSGSGLGGQTAVFACCLALSIQSLSVLLQVRSLLPRAISIGPLLAARVIHLPLSLSFVYIGLRLWPGVAPVYSSLAPRVLARSRTAPDVGFVLFLLCCVVLYRLYNRSPAK